MRRSSIAISFLVVGTLIAGSVATSAIAAEKRPPEWMKQSYPEAALPAAVAELKAVRNPKGALDAKTKYLISLGVAAQIPCRYCIYIHTKQAKAAGATDAQIKEAVAAAALTRKWSTVLNGSAYDFDKFKQWVDARYVGQ